MLSKEVMGADSSGQGCLSREGREEASVRAGAPATFSVGGLIPGHRGFPREVVAKCTGAPKAKREGSGVGGCEQGHTGREGHAQAAFLTPGSPKAQ